MISGATAYTSQQSVNVVDCPEFRAFVLFGRTDVSEKDLPHRTSLTKKLFDKFDAAHLALIEELKVSPSAIYRCSYHMLRRDTHVYHARGP